MHGGLALPPVEMKLCAGILDLVGVRLRAQLNAALHFAIICQNWFTATTKLALWSAMTTLLIVY